MLNLLRQKIWAWRGVLIAAPSVAGIVILLRLVGILQPLEWFAYDLMFLARPLEPQDQRIVIVGINEADIQKLGHYPVNDGEIAQLLEKIKSQKPKAIGLDIVRDFPVEPGHAALAKIFRTTPNLIGVEKIADRNVSFNAIGSPPILKQLGQVAAVNVAPVDSDSKLRRGLLSLEAPNHDVMITLGLSLALTYLNAETKEIPNPEAINPPAFMPNDGGYMAADAGGHQILLNFRKEGFQQVSMADVIENRIAADLFRDRIVLVGITATSLKDFFTVPYDNGLWKTSTQTSGVEIHSHLTSHILSAALDNRVSIKVWKTSTEWLWIIGWAMIGSTLRWQWRSLQQSSNRLTNLIFSIWRSGGTLILSFLLVGFSYSAFLGGWWVPLVPALLALLGSELVVISYIARSANEIRAHFSRYLTNEVVATLLETPEGLHFGGERRKVTILMCDLRGFSSISEQLPPEKVVEILNIFLGKMTEIITEHQGTIDEFIGDAILVIFGAPIQRVDDAQRAVACAIAMQLSMEYVNAEIQRLHLPQIAMGIGINTGDVVVGNIGSRARAKYAVVGSNVNLTSRIESYTVGGQILISEPTFMEGQEIIKIYKEMEVEPKGVKKPITIYDVKSIAGKYNVTLAEVAEKFLTLKSPISVQFRILEDKHMGEDMFHGILVKLSNGSAEMLSENPVPTLSNIRMVLVVEVEQCRQKEIYAKVMATELEHIQGLYIRFTNMPPEVSQWLQSIYSAHVI
jgi:adenylate cyclase